MSTKTTIKILLILLIITAIILSLSSVQIFKKTPSPEEIPIELVNTFSQQMQNKIINEIGQPIEGFEPPMFIQAFPNLKYEDFNNVQALEGIYIFENSKLTFKRTKKTPITSAEQTITDEGMETLLENIADRLNIKIIDATSITQIIINLEQSIKTFCEETQRNAGACIKIYKPVCGWNNSEKIQCITFPCASTYGNSCEACSNEDVLYYTDGECPKTN
tara:strand:+ start:4956 stop:5612 length:657 start_codon:yes stop_codon:yes gene_type:complete